MGFVGWKKWEEFFNSGGGVVEDEKLENEFFTFLKWPDYGLKRKKYEITWANWKIFFRDYNPKSLTL
jgi:hypothetical protein